MSTGIYVFDPFTFIYSPTDHGAKFLLFFILVIEASSINVRYLLYLCRIHAVAKILADSQSDHNNCVSGITQLDQVPAAKFTLYRREQIEIGESELVNPLPGLLKPTKQYFFRIVEVFFSYLLLKNVFGERSSRICVNCTIVKLSNLRKFKGSSLKR
jgi:hypothetical protein